MTPALLSVMCGCGHERRMHDTGSIFVGYQTKCHKFHIGATEPDCFYFEPVDGWQEGYLVERAARDNRGWFTRTMA